MGKVLTSSLKCTMTLALKKIYNNNTCNNFTKTCGYWELYKKSCVSRASHVPVGNDQLQHLELARDIAVSFNSTYGPTFEIPTHILGTARYASIKNCLRMEFLMCTYSLLF